MEPPERYVIDFQQRDILECQEFSAAFLAVRSTVLPDRESKARKSPESGGVVRPHHRQFLERWWKLSWDRAEMLQAIESLGGRFIACSRVSKRPIFVFVSTGIRPADIVQVFIFDDDYSFGVLQSAIHWTWYITRCSKLTERFRYTTDTVFDTFPWPQAPTAAQIDLVAHAGREVRRSRRITCPRLEEACVRSIEL